MVIDDEPYVCGALKKVLERAGFEVETAPGPEEALFMMLKREPQVVITDVIMPDMNGRDLASELLSRHPHINHLFMSGYTADVIAHKGVLDEGVAFIQKPFSREALAGKVREVLGRT